jgi:hypothetical protein
MISIIKIHNELWGEVVHIGPVYTVGGEEGIFGIYKEDGSNLIHLVRGDDGYWMHLYQFDAAWLWRFSQMFFFFYRDWKLEQYAKEREKKKDG